MLTYDPRLTYDPLCQTIKTRENLIKQLATTPWYLWFKRHELRGKIEDLSSSITAEKMLDLANEIGSIVWSRAAAKLIPEKNPYGPATKTRFDDILEEAVKLRDGYVVFDGSCSFPLTELPELDDVLTRDFIVENATRLIEERDAIAASPTLIHEYSTNSQGQKILAIQHVASGLRAQFTLDGQGFGSVESKPYLLYSIDPDKPGKLDNREWEDVVGLGIGPRIYKEAQRLEPTYRWQGGMFSEYSRPLRARLHAAEPYVWDGPCKWCDVNLPLLGVHHWMNATQSLFNAHHP
jgi:hypothetical protein